jgi:mevalonate kinase
MKQIHSTQAQAHGKLILIGEHAVVYHEPAIALPFFPVSINVKLEPSEENQIYSALYQGSLVDAPKHLAHITQLILALQEAFNLAPFKLFVESSIPISAGMGSSAALASALVKSAYQGIDVSLDQKAHIEWIQFAERIAHGNPSGIDALTTSYESAWWFIKDQGFEALSIKMEAVLIVANTEIHGSTKTAVEKVRQLIQLKPDTMAHIHALGQLAYQARHAIQQQSPPLLGAILTQAHHHLQALEVSHPKLDEMVNTALQAGALGAKMTGGGLGGCMIALAHTDAEAKIIIHALKQHSYSIWTHQLS